MYADRGLPQVDLRKQFVKDIISLIQFFTKQGHDIILMMDANEASGNGSAADTISIACAPRVNPFWALSCSPAQDSSKGKVGRGRVVTCESHEFGPAQSSRGSSSLSVD